MYYTSIFILCQEVFHLFLTYLLIFGEKCDIINIDLVIFYEKGIENMRIIGYACVKNNKLSLRREDEFKKTKAYKQLKNLNIEDEHIIIDILTVNHQERTHFNKLLEELSEKDVIIVPDINALGNNKNEVLERYIKLYEKRIGIIIPDEGKQNMVSDLSTTDFSFSSCYISEEDFGEKCKLILNKKQRSNRGRPQSELNDKFIEIYWLYERFLIEEPVAYDNVHFHMSKGGFHKLAEIYESNPNYFVDEEKQEEQYKISDIVKRRGTVPEDFDKVYSEFSEEEILSMNVKQDDLLAVCDKHGVRRMSVVLFKRYYIKAIWGRKASVRETIHRKDNELNESLKRKDN